MTYKCENCKNNNNGWCNVKKFNGLKKKNIQQCNDFQQKLNDEIEQDYICKTQLSFSDALQVLKNGGKVARKGWNGKGMFVKKVELRINNEALTFIDNQCLVLSNVKGTFNTWIPSITDLFAEDWEVV